MQTALAGETRFEHATYGEQLSYGAVKLCDFTAPFYFDLTFKLWRGHWYFINDPAFFYCRKIRRRCRYESIKSYGRYWKTIGVWRIHSFKGSNRDCYFPDRLAVRLH